MLRTIGAVAAPALVVAFAWIRLEEPRRTGEVVAVAALAVLPALAPRWWQRAAILGVALLAVAALVAEVRPWHLPPFADAPVVDPVTRTVSDGLGDFYGVVLPFAPASHPEMHILVLAAIFGFVAATALLVAARLPLAAAGATLAGAGWPATLLDTGAVAIGAVALVAALSIFLALRVHSVPALAAGAVLAAVVVGGAVWASSATTLAQRAALDWESWDLRGLPAKALGVRFVWDANYDGVAFPKTPTVVLEIEGPERAQYWRVATLDRFTVDRWLVESDDPLLVGAGRGPVPSGSLTPARARLRENWLEQRVEVKALVDDRIAAAGTPVELDARALGTVFYLAGGVVRARRSLEEGTRYTVWSYVPDPAPAALAATPPRFPRATARYLRLWGKALPPYGARERNRTLRGLLTERHSPLAAYTALYDRARLVAADAQTPYAAVLALEAWFRREGGFRYEEQPARATGVPPLVHFVEVSRAGYCQHYAGAMAVMLRLLGIPARVAVGFTSGTRTGDTWKVSDHNAHAWVEVWFPRFGWVAFDPTPGRGTFAGTYSFASENAQAVESLARGDLGSVPDTGGRGFSEREAGTGTQSSDRDPRPSLLTLTLVLAALVSVAIGSGKWVRRRARYVTRNPRRLAAATRQELEEFLRDQRVELPPSPTLSELRRALELELGVDGRRFADAAGRGRFGRPDAVSRSSRAARQELRSLLRKARRELSPWARARGFVSLRSLRAGTS